MIFVNWDEEVFNIENINDIYNNFIEKYLKFIEKYVLIKIVIIWFFDKFYISIVICKWMW